jgi:two-component system chemotaxis sensor kinase CheA
VASDTTRIDEGILVLLEHQGESVCLFIDEVMGQQQTVIKPLPDYMRNIRGLSGCSIMGDGQVCLIIDVGGLIEKYRDEYRLLFNESISLAAGAARTAECV